MTPFESLENQLARLTEIGIALSSERDLKKLLAAILQQARDFTRAEAASLYIVEPHGLQFVISQNDALERPAESPSLFRNQRLPLSADSMAGHVGLTGNVINLDDVYNIPEDRPYRFNPDYDRKTGYRSRSMLLVPMKERDGRIVGVLQLINARDDRGRLASFDPRYERLVMSLASHAAVAIRNVQLTEQLRHAYHDTILRLAVAAEYKDQGTAEHIRRMSHYSVLIAEQLGFAPDKADRLWYAAPMHDVGKIGVPEAILRKPGPLTPEEFDVMKQHTEIGARILGGSEAPVLQMSAAIALTHHERYDGRGYPRGLQGPRIPIEGRIVALADQFDALSSPRCYKPAYAIDQCLEMIRANSGATFDPEVVDAFFKRLDDVKTVRETTSTQ